MAEKLRRNTTIGRGSVIPNPHIPSGPREPSKQAMTPRISRKLCSVTCDNDSIGDLEACISTATWYFLYTLNPDKNRIKRVNAQGI